MPDLPQARPENVSGSLRKKLDIIPIEHLMALWPPFATAWLSGQVAAHQNRVQLYPVRLTVVALPATGDRKSGAFVKLPGRPVVFLDFQKNATHAAAGEMAEMRHQQAAGKPAPAMAGGNGDGKYFGLV